MYPNNNFLCRHRKPNEVKLKVKDQVYLSKVSPGDSPLIPRDEAGEGDRKKSPGRSKGRDLNTLNTL